MPQEIRGRSIKPATGRNTKGDFGFHPSVSVSKWQIMQPTDVLGGFNMATALASAANTETASGVLFIAADDADPITDRPKDPVARMSPGPFLVGPVDTATGGQSLGAEVYLTDTAGGSALNGIPGTITRVVGHIVKVDATNGYWLFDGRL